MVRDIPYSKIQKNWKIQIYEGNSPDFLDFITVSEKQCGEFCTGDMLFHLNFAPSIFSEKLTILHYRKS